MRKPRPFEVSPDSGGHRTVSGQGSTGPAAGREDVFDGESRLRKADPTSTLRTGSTTDNADVVDEAEGEAGGYIPHREAH